MNEYSKEAIKERFATELKQVYEEILKQEKEKLEELDRERTEAMKAMLHSIAQYDMTVTGGVGKDMNTLNVEIITGIERFRGIDSNPEAKKKREDILSNIAALERLLL